MDTLQAHIGYTNSLKLMFGAFFLIGAATAWKWPSVLNRKIGATALILILLMITAEYWIAGPYSFSRFAVNIDLALSTDLFLLLRTHGELFAHAFADGTDIAAMSINTGQYISFERLLLTAFPLWLANMIHQLTVSGTALIGSYVLARRFGAASPVLALALGVLYAFAHERMTDYTWLHGMGFGLIPALVYVIMIRVERPLYWAGVVAVSAIYAISSSPTHSFFAAFGALFCAALFSLDRYTMRRTGAALLFVAAEIVNWHESLYAKFLLSPFVFRTSAEAITEREAGFVEALANFGERQWIFVSIGLLSVVLAFLRGDRRAFLYAAILIAGFSIGSLADAFPWDLIGLGMLKGVTFQNMSYGFPIIAIMIASTIAPVFRWYKEVAAVFCGLMVASFFTIKIQGISSWLSEGGLQVLSGGLRQLSERAWQPAQPERVVSVPYRLPTNLAAVAGLDTFDGTLNLNLSSYSRYWQYGVQDAYRERHDGAVVEKSSGYVDVQSPDFDFKCCSSYDINRFADLNYLKIANVGYILSTLPLTGGGIRKIAGPADDAPPPRSTEPLERRLREYVALLFHSAPIYVYQLDDPLPRLYAASGIVAASDASDDPAYIRLIGENAPARKIVVFAADAAVLPPARDLRVSDWRLVADGFEATVDSPNGGVLVLNTPFLPFWEAYADDEKTPLRIVPANMIQMAVAIPAGRHQVHVVYNRPRLWERLLGLLARRN